MTAERMPPSKSSRPAGLLELVTRCVVRHPWPTVTVAVAVAAGALLLAATRLELHTSRLDLLNPNSTYNQRWLRYIKEFAHKDDVVVVVEGENRQAIVRAMDDVAAALAVHDRLFHAVLCRIDLARIRAKGLYYLKPAQLTGIDRFLDGVAPIVRGDWSPLDLGHTMAGLGAIQTVPGQSRRLDPGRDSAAAGQWELGRRGLARVPLRPTAARYPTRIAQVSVPPAHSARALPPSAARQPLAAVAADLLTALRGPDHYRCPWPVLPEGPSMAAEKPTEYLLSGGGRFGLVLLRLTDRDNASPGNTAAVTVLRGLLERLKPAHPRVTMGLTGLPVMEQDEMRSSRTATLHASVLSIVGVTCLFAACFGAVRRSLMTVITLALGIGWSIGYATLVVGHLNILSMAFGVILVGLGIDFGIHYLARYQQLRKTTASVEGALCATVAAVGPGVVTGALTTSMAFFTAGLTRFTGIAELGIIAGGGILLCLVATIVVLPALLTLIDRNHSGQIESETLALGGWIAPLHKMSRTTLALSCCVTLALGMGLPRLRYDHNLLNLQPVGLESVELERKLMADSDQSLWFAVSVAANRTELLARKQQFLALPTVKRVDEIASLLPAQTAAKVTLVQRIHDRVRDLPARPPEIPVSSPQALRRAVARLRAGATNGRFGPETAQRLDQIDDLLRRLPAKECYRRLADYQQRAATGLLARLHTLHRISDPEPPRLADLPASLVGRFVSPNHRYLLRVYGKADIWNMDALKQFVQDVRRVDPEATGKPLQTYEASRQMQRSYLLAAFYSLLAVMIILVLDFHSLRVTLLAMLPVGVGIFQMLGLLGLLGIPLNPANMIVLPLILGIGIDDGVHVVHDFRTQVGRYRITNSTATAVLMTSLTSMVGFGSLMIASHRGLESLGRVLTLGVSCCLFASLTTLPAILSWASAGGRIPAPRRAADLASRQAHVAEAPHPIDRPQFVADRNGQRSLEGQPAGQTGHEAS